VFTNETRNAMILRASFDPERGRFTSRFDQITPGTTWAVHPAVSPDGQWVTFSSAGSVQEDIYIMRSDGTGMRQLTNDMARDRWPRFTPDGAGILFYSDQGKDVNIWSIRPDGSGLKPVTHERYAIFEAPSPDGTRLAFFSGDNRTHLLTLATGAQETLAAFAEDNSGFVPFVWSHDGTKIAGARFSSRTRFMQLAYYELGSRRYALFPDLGSQVLWLKDSRRALIGGRGRTWLYDSATGKSEVILAREPGETRAAISPDNRTVFMESNVYASDIWLAQMK
jgi:Tol biopolymer transport system component